MRVLVTGASGMIGSSAADALLARGDEVVGLTRNPEAARFTNPRVRWHLWDPALERPPAEALDGVDGVLNLLGESIDQRLTDSAKRHIMESRKTATRNLVAAIAAAMPRPPVLVSQSAVGYYGDHGEAIIDESVPADSSWVAQLVVDWEAAAIEAEAGGIRVAIMRSAPVLDPAGGLLKQLLPVFKLGLGGPLAGGRQYMPWIHTFDEVGIALWALDTPEVSGQLNATSPNPVTNREFSRALGRALGRPSLIPAPRFAVSALRGSELTAQVLASIRAVPRRALDLGYEFRFPQVEPALRDLLRR
jgi:uncharacterized protein (TIGR01777 family)